MSEGYIVNNTEIEVKSQMIKQLRKLGETTSDQWERAVFGALTGGRREDVDWDFEDNGKGVFLWIKTFDNLVGQLVEDGYVRTVERDGKAMLMATDWDFEGQYNEVSVTPQ